MKKILCLSLLMIASPAVFAVPVLDQANLPGNASFNSTLNWQQEIIVGVGGVLSQVDVFLQGSGDTINVGVNRGSPWQVDANDFFTTVVTNGSGVYSFDVSALNLNFSVGETFSLLLGTGTGFAIRGTFLNDGSDYAGVLYLGGSQFAPGWDLGFRTYMDAVAVPEPTMVLLFGFGLAGLAFFRRKAS